MPRVLQNVRAEQGKIGLLLERSGMSAKRRVPEEHKRARQRLECGDLYVFSGEGAKVGVHALACVGSAGKGASTLKRELQRERTLNTYGDLSPLWIEQTGDQGPVLLKSWTRGKRRLVAHPNSPRWSELRTNSA